MSLIEAMVTLAIVSFGLLGVAGLLLNGIRVNNVSNMRTVAALQVNDMADRVRANYKGLKAGAYNALDTSGSTCESGGAAPAICSEIQQAHSDMNKWNLQNAALLPSGFGSISVVPGLSELFEITVSWDETKSGAAGQKYTLRFQP